MELAVLTRKLGVPIDCVPVTWNNPPGSKVGPFAPFSTTAEMFLLWAGYLTGSWKAQSFAGVRPSRRAAAATAAFGAPRAS